MRQLAQRLCRHHRVQDPRVEAVFQLVAELLGRHGTRYAEIFEPSLSWLGAEAQLLRFSYAFPGYGEQPEDTARCILDLCRPFGTGVREVAARVVRALQAGCVEQPLFGLAYDGPESWRVKLYLQFRAEHGREASALAARLLGGRKLEGGDGEGEGELHMLGLDVGDGGVQRAKLYYRYPRLSVADFAARMGRVELVADLARAGMAELCELLAIHHLTSAGAGDIGPVREIDFALRDNGLLPRDLEASPSLARLFDPAGPAAPLFASFPLAIRRVSVATGGSDKLNVYYLLTG